MIELPTIEKPARWPPNHSFSSLKTFSEICERRYALDRHLPWTDTPNTLRGSQIHDALEWISNHLFTGAVEDSVDEVYAAAIRAFAAPAPEGARRERVLDADALAEWLNRTRSVWDIFTPCEAEYWIRKTIPGAEWPLVGKVDLRADMLVRDASEAQVIVDWKSVNNMSRVPTEREFYHSLQPRTYSWATGIRRVAFVFFSQHHDAQIVQATFDDADIAWTELWLSETARALERRWEHGGWRLAPLGHGLCSERWCPHWEKCRGAV